MSRKRVDIPVTLSEHSEVSKVLRKADLPVSQFMTDVGVNVDHDGASKYMRGIKDVVHGALAKIPADTDWQDIWPDDLDWTDPDFAFLNKTISDCLNHDFIEVAEGSRGDELATCMNLPVIAAIDCNRELLPNGHVIVLNADRGQDLRRIETTIRNHGFDPQRTTFEVVEEDSRRLALLEEEYVQQKQWQVKAYNMSVRKWANQVLWDGLSNDTDLIVMNMSVHNEFADTVQAEQLMAVVRNRLRHGGKLIGSMIDTGDLKALALVQLAREAPDVVVLAEDGPSPRYPRGSVRCRIKWFEFRDSVLPVEALLAEADRHHMYCQVVKARLLTSRKQLSALHYVVPPHLQKYCGREEMIPVTYVEISHRLKTDDVLANKLPGGVGPRAIWRTAVVGSPEFPQRQFEFPINHGLPFIPSDIIHLDPNQVAIGEKHDGVTAKIVVRGRRGYMLAADGRAFITDYELEVDRDVECYLQAELVSPEWNEVTTHPVVVDVYRISGQMGFTFKQRWLYLSKLMEKYPDLRDLFRLSGFIFNPRVREVFDLYQDAAEGIVIQNVMSPPPGSTAEGTARYIKKQWTKDVRLRPQNQIVEVPIDATEDHQEIKRLRLDKKNPNTEEQVLRMRLAMTIDQFLGLLEGLVADMTPAQERSVVATRCEIIRKFLNNEEVQCAQDLDFDMLSFFFATRKYSSRTRDVLLAVAKHQAVDDTFDRVSRALYTEYISFVSKREYDALHVVRQLATLKGTSVPLEWITQRSEEPIVVPLDF